MSRPLRTQTIRLASLLFALFNLMPAAGLAQAPAASPAGGVANAANAATAATVAGALKPFNEIVKEATEIPGGLPLYQKDDKVWLAIAPEQLEQPFLFAYNIPKSVGERGLYGSQMGDEQLAVWRKVGNQMQLIAKNTRYFAAADTPQARFVAESFSDSLIASTAVVSAPHPVTKAVLIEANSLLFSDIPGYLTRLETAFRMPFALDARNSRFVRLTNTPELTGLQTQVHFNVPKLAAPPLTPPTPPAPPTPPPPKTTPDPRSLFVDFYYNFARLPETPMTPRLADERVGHFVTTRHDYSTDTTVKIPVHYVNRWRLERLDPTAELSPPKQPITYWIDRNVPEKYRQAVRAGILEWNKAFARIGFSDAIVVKQQTDRDNFDTMDTAHASVRWFTGADIGFAIGPSRVDPRTGEILDADIGMSDIFARSVRRLVVEDIGKPHAFDAALAGAMTSPGARRHQPDCHFAEASGQEADFALDLLEARGLDMAGPEAEQLAQAYVKDVIMHEVGHTLGLRHNFRSSTIHPLSRLGDKAFTAALGLGGSVMDYLPINLAVQGEPQGEYVMSTLGPYDYLAIEYAYRPLPAESEASELARIARRTTVEPELAYATDEDAGYGNQALGMDPEVNRFDLGADPLEYYRKRIRITRELWDRLEKLPLKPDESYERLTRSFTAGFSQLARIAPLVAKYVGGVRHRRDRAGTDQALYQPTDAARQRQALALITDTLFRPDSFRLKPELVARLAIDHFERPANPDISIATGVLNLQKSVLDLLLADQVAQRLLDARDKVATPASLLQISDLYESLQKAIWSELATGAEISPLRRGLQREYVRRLATSLVRPGSGTPADARAVQREQARQLARQLTRQVHGTWGRQRGKDSQAHLADCLTTLNEALKAPLQRAGV